MSVKFKQNYFTSLNYGGPVKTWRELFVFRFRKILCCFGEILSLSRNNTSPELEIISGRCFPNSDVKLTTM